MNRTNLIKEGIYYTLGIVLIFGFVYLYWGHFTDTPGPPSAVQYIMSHWGYDTAFVIHSAIFIIFILFLPFRDRIEWRSKGFSPPLSWRYLPKCLVCLCLFTCYNHLALITDYGTPSDWEGLKHRFTIFPDIGPPEPSAFG